MPLQSTSSSGTKSMTPVRSRGSIASRYLEAINACTPQDVSALSMGSPSSDHRSQKRNQNNRYSEPTTPQKVKSPSRGGKWFLSSAVTAQTTGTSSSWTTETRSRASHGAQPNTRQNQQRQGSGSNKPSKRPNESSRGDASMTSATSSRPQHHDQNNSIVLGVEDDCSSIESSRSHEHPNRRKQQNRQKQRQQSQNNSAVPRKHRSLNSKGTGASDVSWMIHSMFPRTFPSNPDNACSALLSGNTLLDERATQPRQSSSSLRPGDGKAYDDIATAPTEVMMNTSSSGNRSRANSASMTPYQLSRTPQRSAPPTYARGDFAPGSFFRGNRNNGNESEAGAPTEVMTNRTPDVVLRQDMTPSPAPTPAPPPQVQRQRAWPRTSLNQHLNKNKTDAYGYHKNPYFPNQQSRPNKPPAVIHSLMDDTSNEESSCLSPRSKTMGEDRQEAMQIETQRVHRNGGMMKSLLDHNDTEESSLSTMEETNVAHMSHMALATRRFRQQVRPRKEAENDNGTVESSIPSIGVETGGKKIQRSDPALKAVFGGKEQALHYRGLNESSKAGATSLNRTNASGHNNAPGMPKGGLSKFVRNLNAKESQGPWIPSTTGSHVTTRKDAGKSSLLDRFGRSNDHRTQRTGHQGYARNVVQNHLRQSNMDAGIPQTNRSLSDESGWTPISFSENGRNAGHEGKRGKSPIMPLFSLDRLDFSFDSQSPIRKLKQRQRSRSLSAKESYEHRKRLRELEDQQNSMLLKDGIPLGRSKSTPTVPSSKNGSTMLEEQDRQQQQKHADVRRHEQEQQGDWADLTNTNQDPDPIFCPESTSSASPNEHVSSADFPKGPATEYENKGVEVHQVLVKTWQDPKEDGSFVDKELVEIMQNVKSRCTEGNIPRGESKSPHFRRSGYGDRVNAPVPSAIETIKPPPRIRKNDGRVFGDSDTYSSVVHPPGHSTKIRSSHRIPESQQASSLNDATLKKVQTGATKSVTERIRAFNTLKTERAGIGPRQSEKTKPTDQNSWRPNTQGPQGSRNMLIMGAHLACLSNDMPEDEKKDDDESVDVQSLRSVFESLASKRTTTEDDDDTASVKSLREFFEPKKIKESKGSLPRDDDDTASVKSLREFFESKGSKASKRTAPNDECDGDDTASVKSLTEFFESKGSKASKRTAPNDECDDDDDASVKSLKEFFESHGIEAEDDDTASVKSLRELFEPPTSGPNCGTENEVGKLRSMFEARKRGSRIRGQGEHSNVNKIRSKFESAASHPPKNISMKKKATSRYPKIAEYLKSHRSYEAEIEVSDDESLSTLGDGDTFADPQQVHVEMGVAVQIADHWEKPPAQNKNIRPEKAEPAQKLANSGKKSDEGLSRLSVVSHFQSMRDRLEAMALAKAKNGLPLSPNELNAIAKGAPERSNNRHGQGQTTDNVRLPHPATEAHIENSTLNHSGSKTNRLNATQATHKQVGNSPPLETSSSRSTSSAAEGFFGRTNREVRAKQAGQEASAERSANHASASSRSEISKTDAVQMEKPVDKDDATKNVSREEASSRKAIFRMEGDDGTKTRSEATPSDNRDNFPQKNDHKGQSVESEFSDGVTLDFSTAEVSNLTNPTAISSKDSGDPLPTPTSSIEEADAKRSEASSTQTSEAAAPLIAALNPKSDDMSGYVKHGGTRKAGMNNSGKWVANQVYSKMENDRKVAQQNDSPNFDMAWDIHAVDSFFDGDQKSDPFAFDEWDAFDPWDATLSTAMNKDLNGLQQISRGNSSRSSTPTRKNAQSTITKLERRTTPGESVPSPSEDNRLTPPRSTTPLSQARTVQTSTRRNTTQPRPGTPVSHSPNRTLHSSLNATTTTPTRHGLLRQQNREASQTLVQPRTPQNYSETSQRPNSARPTIQTRPVTPNTPVQLSSTRQAFNLINRHNVLKSHNPVTQNRDRGAPPAPQQSFHTATHTPKVSSPLKTPDRLVPQPDGNSVSGHHMPVSQPAEAQISTNVPSRWFPRKPNQQASIGTRPSIPTAQPAVAHEESASSQLGFGSAGERATAHHTRSLNQRSPASVLDHAALTGDFQPKKFADESSMRSTHILGTAQNSSPSRHELGSHVPSSRQSLPATHIQRRNVKVDAPSPSHPPSHPPPPPPPPSKREAARNSQQTSGTSRELTPQEHERRIQSSVLDQDHAVVMQSRHQMLMSRQRAHRLRKLARQAGNNGPHSPARSDLSLGSPRNPVEPPGSRIASPPTAAASSITSQRARTSSIETSTTAATTSTSGAYFGRTHPSRRPISSTQDYNAYRSPRRNDAPSRASHSSEISSATSSIVRSTHQTNAPYAGGQITPESEPSSRLPTHRKNTSGFSSSEDVLLPQVKSRFGMSAKSSAGISDTNTNSTNSSQRSTKNQALMARLRAVKQSRMRRTTDRQHRSGLSNDPPGMDAPGMRGDLSEPWIAVDVRRSDPTVPRVSHWFDYGHATALGSSAKFLDAMLEVE